MPPLPHRPSFLALPTTKRRFPTALGSFTIAALLGTACGDVGMHQMEPRTIAGSSDRIFQARGEGEAALVYLAQEAWGVPGTYRTGGRLETRYVLVTRRAADGRIIAEQPVGIVRDPTREAVPTVLGVVDGRLWLAHDSVTRWQLPSLTRVVAASADDSIEAQLRSAPWFDKPGQAKAWSEVRDARLVYARTPSLRSPPGAFVIAHANDIPWRLDGPSGWLAFATVDGDRDRADLLRVTDDEQVVWRLPLALRASKPFEVLDLGTHAVLQQRVDAVRQPVLNTSIEREIKPATLVWWSVDLATGTVTEFSVEEQARR